MISQSPPRTQAFSSFILFLRRVPAIIFNILKAQKPVPKAGSCSVCRLKKQQATVTIYLSGSLYAVFSPAPLSANRAHIKYNAAYTSANPAAAPTVQ